MPNSINFTGWTKKISLSTVASLLVGIVVLVLLQITSLSVWQTMKRLEDLNLSQSRIEVIRGLDSMRVEIGRLNTYEHLLLETGNRGYAVAAEKSVIRIKDLGNQLESNLSRRHNLLLAQLRLLLDYRFDKTREAIEAVEAIDQGQRQRLIASRYGSLIAVDDAKKQDRNEAEFQELYDKLEEVALNIEMDFIKRDLRLEQGSMQTIISLVMLVAATVTALLLLLILVKKYVTERTVAKKNLSEAETRFQAVFNQSFQFSGILSPTGVVVETNQASLEFVGAHSADVTGKYLWETPWWSHSKEVQSSIEDSVHRAAKGELVRLNVEASGKLRRAVVDFSLRPVLSEENQVEYLVVESRDISKELEATEALADSEARMRAIVQTASDGILTFGSNGIIESLNPAMRTILVPPELENELENQGAYEIVGSSLSGFFAPDILGETDTINAVAAGEKKILGASGNLFALRPDGSRIPVEVTLGMIDLCETKSQEDRLFTLIVRDLSERLEAQNRVRDFYSTVSHELRTPLTAIRTALGLIKENVADSNNLGENSSTVTTVVDIATDEADRLIRMVNDILDIRKLESGKLHLELEQVQTSSLMDRAVQAVSGIGAGRGIKVLNKFNNQEPGLDYAIVCDPDRIHQVFTNLLSNAISFSPDDGIVEMRVCLLSEAPDSENSGLENEKNGSNFKWLRFSVIDQGPGIAEADSKKIFGRFEQLSNRSERAKGGTGLGLAIAKGIVETHGGRIGVARPEDCENGSEFWFDLPIE